VVANDCIDRCTYIQLLHDSGDNIRNQSAKRKTLTKHQYTILAKVTKKESLNKLGFRNLYHFAVIMTNC